MPKRQDFGMHNVPGHDDPANEVVNEAAVRRAALRRLRAGTACAGLLAVAISGLAGPALGQTLLPDGVAPPAGATAGNAPGGETLGPPGLGQPGAGQPGGGQPGGGLENVVALLGGSQEGTEALVGALTGTPEGMDQLSAFLDSTQADPDQVADKAQALLAALQEGNLIQDPVVLQEAVNRIEEAAAGSVVAAPVMKTVVTPDFEIDERRIGYDFGPADGDLMRGFQRVEVTEDAFRTEDGRQQDIQTVRRPSGDPLLIDGIVGVEEITLPAPNGRWRVVILSNDFGDSARYGSPFGEAVEVNGSELRIANSDPDDWMDSIALTNARGTDVQAGDFDFVDPSQRGGAIVLDTVVSGGMLRIRFRPRPGQRTLLSGIVLEPSDSQDSMLQPRTTEVAGVLSRNLQDQQQRRDRRQQAESRIQDAVAQVLTNIATAAGPQQDVAALLGPPDPVVDRGTTISAN